VKIMPLTQMIKASKTFDLTILIIVFTAVLNLLIIVQFDQIAYVRAALGLLLATAFTGYPLSHLIIKKNMGIAERILSSFGLSMTVAFFSLILLNFTPIGITSLSVSLALSAVVWVCSGILLAKLARNKAATVDAPLKNGLLNNSEN
jgi:uncharacterized membrane protein